MAYIIRMPKLGMEMQAGVLLEWHVGEGERVEKGAVVAEIESEKTVEEVTARESGVLRRHLLAPDAEVPPGTPLGIVAGESEAIDDLLAEAGAHEHVDVRGDAPTDDEGSGATMDGEAGRSTTDGESGTATTDGQPGDTTAVSGSDGAPAAQEPGSTAAAGAGATTTGAVERSDPGAGRPAPPERKASPRARHRAAVLGVDLDGLDGSGVGGEIIEADVERAAAAGTAASTAVAATPAAKRRARELDVSLADVPGTGPKGAVTVADVEGFVDRDSATVAGDSAGAGGASRATTAETADPADRRPVTRTVAAEGEFSGMRRTIADRLQTSWQRAPHVTVSRDLAVDDLLTAVEAAEEGLDVEVSLVDLLLVALSETLSAHPAFNATLEDGVHRRYEEHNLGLAVDVEAGLVTPVLGRVNEKSLPALAIERRALTERVRAGEFTMDDMQGGTFTVSNLGVFGVDSFTPIVNPPEVAILGVNRVREVPVPAEEGGGVAFERRLRVDLSFDHRAVDGADAARFLGTLADTVADPWDLLLSRV